MTYLLLPTFKPVSRCHTSRCVSGEVVRYVLASIVALIVDFAVLTVLVQAAGMHYTLATSLGFTAGTLVVFLISVVWVFEHRTFATGMAGFAKFAFIGLGGLLLSVSVMAVGVEWLRIDYRACKVGAAGASFVFNFVVRREVLFTSSKKFEASA